jgi:nitrous oxidase accessory protein NosD
MPGRTISVKNNAELTKAIKTAVGGDSILLAPGNYGDVLVNSINPKSTVTIKSASPTVDAVIQGLVISRSSNFVFQDLEIAHTLRAGETEAFRAIRVQLSKDISFVGLDVHGSLDGNINNDGNGFSSLGSSRIAVLDSTFHELNIGAIFGDGEDVIFAGNSVHDTREGINLAAIKDGLVERNFFTNIIPNLAKGDHGDAIQVHAGGTAASSSDLTIRNNVIKIGFVGTHGIYVNNEKGALGQTHKNIVIEDNYYEGNARHGITVNYAQNVVVKDNTVRDTGALGLVPAINISNVKNGVITENIAPLLLGEGTTGNVGVAWTSNIDVFDRLRSVGVSENSLFSSRPGGTSLDFSTLEAKAGSSAAAQGIGFAHIDGIGDIRASSAAIVAAYLPQFDNHYAHAVMV